MAVNDQFAGYAQQGVLAEPMDLSPLGDFGRGLQYSPFDLLGAPVDLVNMGLQSIDALYGARNVLGSEQPFLGSEYLIDKYADLGEATGLFNYQRPTGSIPETVGRVTGGLLAPTGGARLFGEAVDLAEAGMSAYAAGAPARVAERARTTTLGSGFDPTAPIDDMIVRRMEAVSPPADQPDVGLTPLLVEDELRGTVFPTAYMEDGSRVMLDEAGEPYIEDMRINKLKTGTPITEMSSVRTPPSAGILVDEVRVSPEDFEGEWMLQAAGDRTGFGNLVEVDGMPLYGIVEQQGGNDFMRSGRGGWASASGAITSMKNQSDLLRQGKVSESRIDPDTGKAVTKTIDIPKEDQYDLDAPINLITSNMAERSGDFSLDTAETIARAIPSSKIKRSDQKAFDNKIKEKFSDYPGSRDPDKLIEWLQSDAQTDGAGAKRLFFVQTVAASPAQKAGFPDIGSVRAAVSLPETRFIPYGRTGGAISRIADAGEVPVVTRFDGLLSPHPTYPDTIGEGNVYRGGYPVTIPRNLGFPDAYQSMIARGSDPAGIRRAFDVGRQRQFMYPEVVDTQMKYIEDQERLLKEFGLLAR